MGVFQAMQQHGVVSDAITLSALVSALEKGARPEYVLEVVHAMHQQGTVADKKTYAAVISALQMSNEPEQMLHVFQSLRQHGVILDAITYMALIGASDQANRPEQAAGIFQAMQEHAVLISAIHKSSQPALLSAIVPRDAERRDASPCIFASYEGYLQILNFYFLSSASFYSFGGCFFEPICLAPKCNIAIFVVSSTSGMTRYSAFALSGEHAGPGAPPAGDCGFLQASEAPDERGDVFDRRKDAEFKLLIDFCRLLADIQSAKSWEDTAVLWSKKPLCLSCVGAVKQLRRMLPRLQVETVIFEAVEKPML